MGFSTDLLIRQEYIDSVFFKAFDINYTGTSYEAEPHDIERYMILDENEYPNT